MSMRYLGRVISRSAHLKTDRDVVRGSAYADNITTDGVDVVRCRCAGGLDDAEGVLWWMSDKRWIHKVLKAYTVQMEGMRTACSTSGETELDHGVGWQRINASRWKKILRACCTAENLEEDGDSRRNESCSVDLEFQCGTVLSTNVPQRYIKTFAKGRTNAIARLRAKSTQPTQAPPG